MNLEHYWKLSCVLGLRLEIFSQGNKRKGERRNLRPSPCFPSPELFNFRRKARATAARTFPAFAFYAPRSLRSSLACCSAFLAPPFASASGFCI